MITLHPVALPHPVLPPRPFPSPTTYALGSLLRSPSTTAASLAPTPLTPRDHDDTHLIAYYKDICSISVRSNTFLSSLGGELLVPAPAPGTALVSIEAERCWMRMLKRVGEAFGRVVGSEGGRAWLGEEAARKGGVARVYFVAALREVENARYRRCGMGKARNGLVEVVPGEAVVPVMVGKEGMRRGLVRRDSGFDEPTFTKRDVVGVELREVLVRVERPDKPHGIADLEYRWTYINMGEEEQLAVGLGRALEQEEMLGFWDEEREDGEDEETEDEEREGSSADEL